MHTNRQALRLRLCVSFLTVVSIHKLPMADSAIRESELETEGRAHSPHLFRSRGFVVFFCVLSDGCAAFISRAVPSYLFCCKCQAPVLFLSLITSLQTAEHEDVRQTDRHPLSLSESAANYAKTAWRIKKTVRCVLKKD